MTRTLNVEARPGTAKGAPVRRHCEEGEKIVGGTKFPDEVTAAVRHHHDRFDNGGDQLSLLTSILAVAERFEALTAGRGAIRVSSAEALSEVRNGSGTQFDPAVVEALARTVQDGSLELNLPDLAFPAVAAPTQVISLSGLNLPAQAR